MQYHAVPSHHVRDRHQHVLRSVQWVVNHRRLAGSCQQQQKNEKKNYSQIKTSFFLTSTCSSTIIMTSQISRCQTVRWGRSSDTGFTVSPSMEKSPWGGDWEEQPFTAWDDHSRRWSSGWERTTAASCHTSTGWTCHTSVAAFVALTCKHQNTSSRVDQPTKTSDVKPSQRKWSSRRSCTAALKKDCWLHPQDWADDLSVAWPPVTLQWVPLWRWYPKQRGTSSRIGQFTER